MQVRRGDTAVHLEALDNLRDRLDVVVAAHEVDRLVLPGVDELLRRLPIRLDPVVGKFVLVRHENHGDLEEAALVRERNRVVAGLPCGKPVKPPGELLGVSKTILRRLPGMELVAEQTVLGQENPRHPASCCVPRTAGRAGAGPSAGTP